MEPRFCGLGRKSLPLKVAQERVAALQALVECTRNEVQDIYSRFRRLAPGGYLSLSSFSRCLGLLGTFGRCLVERIFLAFDQDQDGLLDFDEFAGSILVMLKGSRERRLDLSFRIIAPGDMYSRGVTLEAFKEVVLDVETAQALLVGTNVSFPRQRLVERVFHQVATYRDADGTLRMTRQDYDKAVDVNADLLSLLGASPLLCAIETAIGDFKRLHSRGKTRSVFHSRGDSLGVHDLRGVKESSRESGGAQSGVGVQGLPFTSSGVQGTALEGNDTSTADATVTATATGTNRENQGSALNPKIAVEASTTTKTAGNAAKPPKIDDSLCYINKANVPKRSVKKSVPFPSTHYPYSASGGDPHKRFKRGVLVHFGHERWDDVINMMIGLSLCARRVYTWGDSGGVSGGAQSGVGVQGLPFTSSGVQGTALEGNDTSTADATATATATNRENQGSALNPSCASSATPAASETLPMDAYTETLKFGIAETLLKRANCPKSKIHVEEQYRRFYNSTSGGSRVPGLPFMGPGAQAGPQTAKTSSPAPVVPKKTITPETSRVQDGTALDSNTSCASTTPSTSHKAPKIIIGTSDFDDGPASDATVNIGDDPLLEAPSLIWATPEGSAHNLISPLPSQAESSLDQVSAYIPSVQFPVTLTSRSAAEIPHVDPSNDVVIKEYAPRVFKRIRQMFGLDEKSYLESVGPEQLVGNLVLGNLSTMSELVSQGKSGALFYYTVNGRLILKTITKACAKFIKRWLKDYFGHVASHPDTLLTLFFGLFSLKYPMDKYKTYFVLMNNVFYSKVPIHCRFDIKGSWVGRKLAQAERVDHTVALKDIDLDESGEDFDLGDKALGFVHAAQRDVAFLLESQLLDYSLLLGIHYKGKPPPTGEVLLDGGDADWSWLENEEHYRCIKDPSGSKIYYFCIIDVLTSWNARKRMERVWRGISTLNNPGVSCVHPQRYAQRFLECLEKHFAAKQQS